MRRASRSVSRGGARGGAGVLTLAALVVWGSGLAACGGGGEGPVASVPPAGSGMSGAPAGSAAPRPGAPSRASLEVGEHQTAGGTLTIRSVEGDRVRFSLVFVVPSQGAHHAELDDVLATKNAAGDYVLAPDPDCSITLRAAGVGAIAVKQMGDCSSQGFGAFVVVDGTYERR